MLFLWHAAVCKVFDNIIQIVMLKQENIFFKLVNLQECDFERQQCVKSYLY